ncbi:MAG TPA: hypothetical protein VMR97_13250 [Acidimicrobiales bacterium]|nr:hypothetical protein [Acidimicrobiales bacterium]
MVTHQLVNVGPLAFGGVFAAIGLLSVGPLALIILVVANRAEPDARGMRPFTVYLFGMAFVTLLLAYGGLTAIVTALLSFIGPHPAPIADGVARSVVIGALFLLIAGATMGVHVRKGLAFARGDGRVDGPNARVLHTYIATVSFVFVVLAMVALGVGVYLLFQLIGPGIFGLSGGDRTTTLRLLLDVAYVLVASGAIIAAHWRQSPPGLMRSAVAHTTPPGAAVSPPPAS